MAINWTQVNIPTILAVLGVGWGVANYVSKIDNRLGNVEEYRVSRGVQTDKNFADVNRRLDGLASTYQDLPIRVNIVEKSIDNVEKRQDRLSELILDSVEGIRKDVNTVGTKVEVLSSKVDDIFPQRKTSLERGSIPAVN